MKNVGRVVFWWCFLVFFSQGAAFAQTMERLVEEIEPQVVELRGLPFLAEVEKTFQSPDDLREYLEQEIARSYPDDTLEDMSKRLLKFGFVVRPVDLRQEVMRLLSQQIGGYYDPIHKKMVLIERAGTARTRGNDAFTQTMARIMAQQMGVSLDKILLAHELTHVIQDQHFDLMSLPFEDLAHEDQATAARALIEGDATMVMLDYVLHQQHPGVHVTMVPEVAENMRAWSTNPLVRGFAMFQTVPRYLTENLLFPYLDGFEFVLLLKQQGGWDAVNQAFQDLPASTEQILHPEKYLHERDEPVRITLPDLSEDLPSWKELERNTLGEFNIHLLLDGYLPDQEAIQAGEGWDGDRFILLEHQNSGQLGLCWYTTWDTEHEAKEFFHIYTRFLNKRHNDTMAGEKSRSPDSAQRIWDTPQEYIALEIRGKDVLLVDGVPAPDAESVFSRLWEQTRR